jgi:hypothetical protein
MYFRLKIKFKGVIEKPIVIVGYNGFTYKANKYDSWYQMAIHQTMSITNHGYNKHFLLVTKSSLNGRTEKGGRGARGAPFITVIIEFGYSLIRKCGTELIYEGQKNFNRKTVPKYKLKLASEKMYFQVK